MPTTSINLTIETKPLVLPVKDHLANLARVSESLHFGVLDHFRESGLTYVDVPEIVGITGACENVDTLFKIGNHNNIPLFFAQTGQLSLEQALQSFHGVCTTIHSGRDEEIEDERHLRQFRLTEEEFDATVAHMSRTAYDEERMFETLLSHIQQAIQSILRSVLKNHEALLNSTYNRTTEKLRQACHSPFLRITYEDAVTLLRQHGFNMLKFGDDLKSSEEAKVVELLNARGEELPVFITHYPKEIKFFNMKVRLRDPRTVHSCDCIFPHAGEGVGSAVREHEFAKLNERLLNSTMYKLHVERGGTYEDFRWYLSIIEEQRTEPHAGYGIGNERVLQYIFGTKDIRRVSLFSLLNAETHDWEMR